MGNKVFSKTISLPPLAVPTGPLHADGAEKGWSTASHYIESTSTRVPTRFYAEFCTSARATLPPYIVPMNIGARLLC